MDNEISKPSEKGKENDIGNDIENECQNDLNDLKELAGKYTLLKYGNSLKQIKIKKKLMDNIKNKNVLNLYTFK